MCFFDQTRWSCGFWRWGNLREQCSREYRIGETCGLKLVYDTDFKETICHICEHISRKTNRMDDMARKIERWRREGDRPATIERTESDIASLSQAISVLLDQHQGTTLRRRGLVH